MPGRTWLTLRRGDGALYQQELPEGWLTPADIYLAQTAPRWWVEYHAEWGQVIGQANPDIGDIPFYEEG